MNPHSPVNPRVGPSARGGLNERIGQELVRRLGERAPQPTISLTFEDEWPDFDSDGDAMLALLDAMRELGFRFHIQQIDSIGIYDGDAMLGTPGFEVRAFRVSDGCMGEWEWEPIENPDSTHRHNNYLWREATAPAAVAKAAARALGVDADA